MLVYINVYWVAKKGYTSLLDTSAGGMVLLQTGVGADNDVHLQALFCGVSIGW